MQVPDFMDNSHPETCEVLDYYLRTEPLAGDLGRNFAAAIRWSTASTGWRRSSPWSRPARRDVRIRGSRR